MEMKALVDRLREAANADKKASPNTANEKPVTQSLEENKTEEKIEKGKEESKPKKQTKSKKSLTADSDSSKLINDIQQLTFDEPLLVTTIRFPESVLRKLKLLGYDNLSIQKVTLYALDKLLQEQEINERINAIVKKLTNDT